MDRGNSLPCVLEQKVRGSSRAMGGGQGTEASTVGWPAWEEARKVNALWDPPGIADGEAGGARWQHGMNPMALQADKGAWGIDG